MEFYSVDCITKNHGHIVAHENHRMLLKNIPYNKVCIITWDNIEQMYKRFGGLTGFKLYARKRGKIISFWNRPIFPLFCKQWERDIKEWKETELDLTFEIKYNVIHDPSYKEIVMKETFEDAAQYFKEHYLNTGR